MSNTLNVRRFVDSGHQSTRQLRALERKKENRCRHTENLSNQARNLGVSVMELRKLLALEIAQYDYRVGARRDAPAMEQPRLRKLDQPYASLPVRAWNGWEFACCGCDAVDVQEDSRMNTDVGEQNVITCHLCGQRMRKS